LEIIANLLDVDVRELIEPSKRKNKS
jgi:hypothetical protein